MSGLNTLQTALSSENNISDVPGETGRLEGRLYKSRIKGGQGFSPEAHQTERGPSLKENCQNTTYMNY